MGGRNDLDNTLFTGGRESTPVVLEKRLERLLGLPLRMLSGRCSHAAKANWKSIGCSHQSVPSSVAEHSSSIAVRTGAPIRRQF
jgi:hypothetical protein